MACIRVKAATWACVAIGTLLGATAAVSADVAHDRDERFLDGLDQRGLDRLVEVYCRRRLSQPELSPAKQALLTVRWARALAQRAVGSPPECRQPLWSEAHAIVEQFLQRSPDHPRRLLVEFQNALIHLARGELARRESEVVLQGQPLLTESTTELRAAIQQLDQLGQRIDDALRTTATPRTPALGQRDDRLTDDELASLSHNVRYQLARARRNQALCFAADSPDRAHALTQAVQLLDTLASLDSAHPLAWPSRLQRVACRRLLGNFAAAGQELDALLAANVPSDIRLDAQAEQIQLALDAGRLDQAMKLLALPRRIDGATSAALDYVRIETALRAWRAAAAAGDDAAATRWREQAVRGAGRMEIDHGPYWSRRAEMLLARFYREPGGDDDVESLVHAAESSYLGGQTDDAVATYDRASELAAQHDQGDRAVELGYAAAMIEQQRGRHQVAMDRCRRLALVLPQQSQSPQVHLQAIRNAAEIAKDGSDDAWDQYRTLVEEHVEMWPAAATTGQALWWLGRLREHAGDWPGAIAAYTRIAAADPNYAAAVAAVGTCYEAWLRTLGEAGQPTVELATRAALWFESVAAPGGRLNQPPSATARAAALQAARFWLDGPPTGPTRAQQLLAAAMADAADAPPEWIASAGALRVSALAVEGRVDEARRQLEPLTSHPALILEVLRGLQRASLSSPDPRRAELARLQLDAIDMLRAQYAALSESEQQTLQRLHAGALADAGRVDEALTAYAALAQAHPRDAAIQEAYARLLAAKPDAASCERALSEWRGVEAKAKPGSDLWFRAKYAVAELHYRLGRPEQAAEMITLLELLRPELGGPAMKSQFLRLRDRCQKP